MKTIQHLSKRLDSLAEKIEASDQQDSTTTTESPVILGSAMTYWADRQLDELLDSLPMPQYYQETESQQSDTGPNHTHTHT